MTFMVTGRNRGLACLVVVIGLATAGTATAAIGASSARSPISWAPQGGGHRYGWAAEPAGGHWRCTPKARRFDQHSSLCATSDGGKHWRRVFDIDSSWRGGSPSLLDVLRWSPRAGVISVPANGVNSTGHVEFWTRDGGRHWWRTDVFNAGFDGTCNWDSVSFQCIDRVDFSRARSKLRFRSTGWTRTPNPNPSLPPQDTPIARTYVLGGWVPAGRLSCPQWGGTRRHRICQASRDAGLRAVPLTP
jgi:hypothetical protein